MIRKFPKGSIEQLSKNFIAREFACHCRYDDCQDTYIDEDLVTALQELRDLIAQPIIIHRGFSCAAHNLSVGGKPESRHLFGQGADLGCVGVRVDALEKAAKKILFFSNSGIGKYTHHLHVDVGRPHAARWIG